MSRRRYTVVLRLEHPSDTLKMLHETLCFAEHAVLRSPYPEQAKLHQARIARMLKEVERQRPLGPNGKHRNLHTPTCGCDTPTWRTRWCAPRSTSQGVTGAGRAARTLARLYDAAEKHHARQLAKHRQGNP